MDLETFFFNNEAFKEAAKQRITYAGADFTNSVVQALFQHWQKCITKCGDYVEKYCFLAETLLYEVVLCSFHLLQFLYQKKKKPLLSDNPRIRNTIGDWLATGGKKCIS